MDLPVKKAVFDENDPQMGLKMISLVNDPAIQVQWIKFNEQKEITLAIQDEERMQFITPVLIPDQLIKRTIDGESFYLTFDAETIRKVAYQWQKRNLSNTVDMDHTRQLIQGVHFCETFLSDKNTVLSVKGFEALPIGTWYVVGRADNAEAWAPIKNGEVKGVSIDGLFGIQAQMKAEVKFTEVKVANDNSLFVDGEIAVGSSVYYNRPEIVMINGQRSEIKRLVWETQIVLDNGTVLTLADGKITEVSAVNITDSKLKAILEKIYHS